MYLVLDRIKLLGRQLKDELTGKSVADEIEDELRKHRAITVGYTREPVIVRDALRVYNQMTAYGLNNEDFNKIMKDYLQYGFRDNSNK